uniref:Cytochrome P450 4B1-like n=1 Tax=Terrapene triunguis TaxID=2587831 RepID=A0A674J3Z6_9SAUR
MVSSLQINSNSDVSRIFYLPIVLCLTYMVLKAIKLYQWRRELNKALKSFPGPPVHWLFGNVHEFTGRGKDLDKVLEWSKKYARAFPVWFGKFVVFVTLNDADYAKAVCARGDPKDNIFYHYVLPWIGKGLLTLQGRKWFQHRKLLTPGFHYGVLKPYVSLITKSTQVMLDKWEHLITQEKSVELFGHVSLMTLDSILKCAFSHESNCQIDRSVQGWYIYLMFAKDSIRCNVVQQQQYISGLIPSLAQYPCLIRMKRELDYLMKTYVLRWTLSCLGVMIPQPAGSLGPYTAWPCTQSTSRNGSASSDLLIYLKIQLPTLNTNRH